MHAAFSSHYFSLAAGGFAAILLAIPATAQPAANAAAATPPTSCAVAYRSALDLVRDKRAEALSALVRTVRAGDPQLSGRWLFSAAIFDPSRKPKTERICAETVAGRNGKSRCAAYETRLLPRVDEPAFTTASSADELKDLKALAQFVEGKGAVPELGANGRFGFLFQRVAQDLRSYLTQEPHPALCAGGSDLTEFYEAQAAPLRRRQTETADLARRTRAAAISRLLAIHKAETVAPEKAVGPAKADAATVAPSSITPAVSAPSNAAAPSVASPLAIAAGPADYVGRSLADLVEAAVRPIATPEQRAAIAAAATPLQAVQAARNAVVASQTGTAATVQGPAVRDAVSHALRMLEAAAYADLQRNRYADIDATMFAATSDIRRAHKATCTCND